MQLHLEGIQLAGSECLLVFITLDFKFSGSIKIQVGVGGNNDGDVNLDLVRSVSPDQIKKAMTGPWKDPHQPGLPGRENNPMNQGIEHHKRRQSSNESCHI